MTSTDNPGRAEQWQQRREVFARLCLLAAWTYFVFVCGLLATLVFAADQWWIGTVLMYGPRWVWAAPLVFLLPIVLFLRRRVWPPVALAVVLLLFGVMRFCIPLHVVGEAHVDRRLRVMTCNADYRDLDTTAFAKLVRDVQPDIVVAQAWSSVHDSAFTDAQWHTRRDGEMFIASRLPLLSSEASTDSAFVGRPGALAHYRVHSSFGLDIDVFNFHAATARQGLSEVIGGWWKGAAAIDANTSERREQSRVASVAASRAVAPAIVAGDFNMSTDSAIYRAFWSDWSNAFSTAGFGFGYTHYTHRTQLRIDHILAGAGWRVRRCQVGPNVGSAHRPVIADIEWAGGG
jgi:endonuclease/exonuclease/phosphatase family metal-dependent hydrolase